MPLFRTRRSGAQYSHDGADDTLQDLLRHIARLFVGRREYRLLFQRGMRIALSHLAGWL